MTLALNGVGAGKGVAIGKARILRRGYFDISHYSVPAHFLADEIARYRAATAAVKRRLESTRRQIPRDTPLDIFALVDVHLMMADDSAFVHDPVRLIEQHRCNAEWALQMQRETLVQAFHAMEDPYLRARADDVEHVARRILYELLNDRPETGPGDQLRDGVVLAEDLAPADAVLLQQHGVRALITEAGGATSHTAILARSLGVPTIVGLRHAVHYIRHDDVLIVDGEQGLVVVDPDARTLRHYQRRQLQERRVRAVLAKLTGKPAVTRDGVTVTLRANAELPEELQTARQSGADGIGLYRTEFLFLDRDDLPGEEEQFEVYLRVVRAMAGTPVTIRSVDLGADKEYAHYAADGGARTNPALGLRGIRRCLKDPAMLRAQLRAILRVSAHGPVQLCIPMLTGVDELLQVLVWVERMKQELDAAGLPFDRGLPVGAMIEVPAAALLADSFASRLDFLSIGTNDLVQYTLAADRLDEDVSYLYDPLHPAVLRLIDLTVQAGARQGVPVAMCGEMAADPRRTRLLLGLGLREFSMHPAMLLEVKQVVRRSELDIARRYARAALDAADVGEVAELVERLNGLP
ncbi:MAG: phosphoenolpyruvate--protein phosphotransferase [Pseudomonadota bacterium]